MKSNLKSEQQLVAVSTINSTIGIDLGDRWSRYCIVDQTGAIAKEDRVRSTVAALEECFGPIQSTRIIIEAGTHSPWVSRLLERMGHQVIVTNARKVRLIYESDRKNDRVDARMLAKLGRVDVSLLAPLNNSLRRLRISDPGKTRSVTRRIPVTTSGLSQPLSADSSARRRIAER
jgi:transposase